MILNILPKVKIPLVPLEAILSWKASNNFYPSLSFASWADDYDLLYPSFPPGHDDIPAVLSDEGAEDYFFFS
jgi:hypothetical protein